MKVGKMNRLTSPQMGLGLCVSVAACGGGSKNDAAASGFKAAVQ